MPQPVVATRIAARLEFSCSALLIGSVNRSPFSRNCQSPTLLASIRRNRRRSEGCVGMPCCSNSLPSRMISPSASNLRSRSGCWRRRQIDLWYRNPLTQPTTHTTRVSAAFDGLAWVRQNRPPGPKFSWHLQ